MIRLKLILKKPVIVKKLAKIFVKNCFKKSAKPVKVSPLYKKTYNDIKQYIYTEPIGPNLNLTEFTIGSSKVVLPAKPVVTYTELLQIKPTEKYMGPYIDQFNIFFENYNNDLEKLNLIIPRTSSIFDKKPCVLTNSRKYVFRNLMRFLINLGIGFKINLTVLFQSIIMGVYCIGHIIYLLIKFGPEIILQLIRIIRILMRWVLRRIWIQKSIVEMQTLCYSATNSEKDLQTVEQVLHQLITAIENDATFNEVKFIIWHLLTNFVYPHVRFYWFFYKRIGFLIGTLVITYKVLKYYQQILQFLAAGSKLIFLVNDNNSNDFATVRHLTESERHKLLKAYQIALNSLKLSLIIDFLALLSSLDCIYQFIPVKELNSITNKIAYRQAKIYQLTLFVVAGVFRSIRVLIIQTANYSKFWKNSPVIFLNILLAFFGFSVIEGTGNSIVNLNPTQVLDLNITRLVTLHTLKEIKSLTKTGLLNRQYLNLNDQIRKLRSLNINCKNDN